MGGPNVGEQLPQQSLSDAYSQLLFNLNEAYWAAGDLSSKDQIRGYSEVVTNLSDQLDAANLAVRDADYTALCQQVTDVNNQLKTLQQQINSIISRINTASTIVSDVTKVLTKAAQLFPGI